MKKFHVSKFIILLILSVIFLTTADIRAQKLTAEDIIAKHLDSIGTAEVRKNMKNQVATGGVRYKVLRKNTGGDGKIVFASEGDKILFGMTFSIPSYPAETIIFDGKNSKVGYAISNTRSEFGDFVYRYKDVVSEGLLGGTLSTAWTLADLSSRKAKIDLSGTKKIDGKEAYLLKYFPNGGSDLQIYIYIDKENYRHLRTEYRRTISSIQGLTPDSSSQQREQRQTMTEDFSDYKKVSDRNLPHSYRLYVMLEGAAGTREYEYKAEFSQFYFNEQLDPKTFATESN